MTIDNDNKRASITAVGGAEFEVNNDGLYAVEVANGRRRLHGFLGIPTSKKEAQDFGKLTKLIVTEVGTDFVDTVEDMESIRCDPASKKYEKCLIKYIMDSPPSPPSPPKSPPPPSPQPPPSPPAPPRPPPPPFPPPRPPPHPPARPCTRTALCTTRQYMDTASRDCKPRVTGEPYPLVYVRSCTPAEVAQENGW